MATSFTEDIPMIIRRVHWFFMAPGQLAGINNKELYQPKGYALVFHADFIHGTSLAKRMHEYSFFGYQSNKELHLSEREKNHP